MSARHSEWFAEEHDGVRGSPCYRWKDATYGARAPRNSIRLLTPPGYESSAAATVPSASRIPPNRSAASLPRIVLKYRSYSVM